MGLLAVCYSEACRHSCPHPTDRQARADCSLPMEQPREDGMPGVPGTRSADSGAPGAQGRILPPKPWRFLKYLLIICLFLAALGLHCCAWAFFSCGEWELLSSCNALASRCCNFSSCRAQALGYVGSVVAAHWLCKCGLSKCGAGA